MFVAESEERTQTERRLGVSIHERIANHHLCTLVNPENLLAENHTADAVSDGRTRSIFEIGDILVSTRLVHTTEAVESQVERLIVLHDGLIQRRKQHISIVARINRGNNQAVVLACIATHDGGTHITATAVSSQHLALQRILQVTKLLFVKFKSRHNYLIVKNYLCSVKLIKFSCNCSEIFEYFQKSTILFTISNEIE